jgi:predicted amidohydrolase YtcJ
MQAAILRRDADGVVIGEHEAITAAEALHAYTVGGAIASQDIDNRGWLTPGAWADLVVLSANPLSVEPGALTDITVDMTFVEGRLAYER